MKIFPLTPARVRGRLQRLVSSLVVALLAPVLRHLDTLVVPPLQRRFSAGVEEVLDAVDVLAETMRNSTGMDASRALVAAVSMAAASASLSVMDAADPLGALGLTAINHGRTGAVAVPASAARADGVTRVVVGFPGTGDAHPAGEHWAVVADGLGGHEVFHGSGRRRPGTVATVHVEAS